MTVGTAKVLVTGAINICSVQTSRSFPGLPFPTVYGKREELGGTERTGRERLSDPQTEPRVEGHVDLLLFAQCSVQNSPPKAGNFYFYFIFFFFEER